MPPSARDDGPSRGEPGGNPPPSACLGVRYTVDVPDEVELTIEVEIGDEGSEIEVEITW